MPRTSSQKKNTQKSKIAITCQNITKTFHSSNVKTKALQGINLDVYEGEFMMLVGPSGCGKTTFLSIIAGILQFDEGDLKVENHNYRTMTDEELIDYRAQHVGFIFQSFNLISTLTVEENVAVPLMINQVSLEDSIKKAREILDEVGLAGRYSSTIRELSGGEQQRVAIARALVHNPPIIICDEPTSALDHTTGSKIMEIMRTINKKFKTTFVVVTHDARIFHYADRIAHMNDGRIERIEDVTKTV